MSVTVRPYRKGGWEVDITTRLPSGLPYRQRRKSPVSSRSGSQRWGEDRERHVLQHGPAQRKREVPTLEEFGPRFLDEHARANRQKPSGIAAKETIIRVHLIPMLGMKRLDAITTQDAQQVKVQLLGKAPKTVNNVLTVLNTMLRKAVEWGVMEQGSCRIRLLPTPITEADFLDFAVYAALVQAARSLDWRAELIVILGGDAGLRCGEMMALEWNDVNATTRRMCVARSEWKGQVTTTKGGRLRHVPLTKRLAEALGRHRHLRSKRVLIDDAGEPLTLKVSSPGCSGRVVQPISP